MKSSESKSEEYYMVPRIRAKWENVKKLDPNSCIYDDEWVRRMTGLFSLYTECCIAIQEYKTHYFADWRYSLFNTMLSKSCMIKSFESLQKIAIDITHNCEDINPCTAPIVYPVVYALHSADKESPTYSKRGYYPIETNVRGFAPDQICLFSDSRSDLLRTLERYPKESVSHFDLFNKAVTSLNVKSLQADVARAVIEYASLFYLSIQDYQAITGNIQDGSKIKDSSEEIKECIDSLIIDLDNRLANEYDAIDIEYGTELNATSPTCIDIKTYKNKDFWKKELDTVLSQLSNLNSVFLDIKSIIHIDGSTLYFDKERMVRFCYRNSIIQNHFSTIAKYVYLLSKYSSCELAMSTPTTDYQPQGIDVYVSYNWEETSNNAVNHLGLILDQEGISYQRDKKDCKYQDNIKSFMDCLRNGALVITFLSKKYLESDNCMYELSGIMDHKDYSKRILPVVVDTAIREDQYYVDLVKAWSDKVSKLDEKITQLSAVPGTEKPMLIKKELGEKVLSLLSEFKEYIDYTNAPSYSSLSDTRFKVIIDKIKEKRG